MAANLLWQGTQRAWWECFKAIPIADGCFPSLLAMLYAESQDEEPDYVNTDPTIDAVVLSK